MPDKEIGYNMKYQFIAGCYHGIVEADSEEEAISKLRLNPELSDVKKILLKKIEEEEGYIK